MKNALDLAIDRFEKSEDPEAAHLTRWLLELRGLRAAANRRRPPIGTPKPKRPMSVYRENAWSSPCEHRRLLNRGAPPNTSNQRVCADCKRTFDPPTHLGGPVTSNDAGPRVTIEDRYER